MTTDTADDNPRTTSRSRHRSGGSRWLMPALIVVALLLHAVLLVGLRPWARTSMAFDPQEEQARTELVKQREAQRLAMQQALRERTVLSPEQAEKLKKEEAERRTAKLRDQVARLAEARRELEQVRARKLDDLKKRTELDLAMHRVRDLKERLNDAKGDAGQVTRWSVPESQTNPTIKAKVKELEDRLAKMADDPSDYKADAEKAADIAQDLEKAAKGVFAEDEDNHQRRHAAVNLTQGAKALEKAAKDLAAGVDAEAANAVAEGEGSESSEMGDHAGDASPAGLYEKAVAMEGDVQRAFDDVQAADLASRRGLGMAEARKQVGSSPPQRPPLGDELKEGDITTIADLDRHRAALDRAVVATGEMAMRSNNLARQARGEPDPLAAAATAATAKPTDASNATRYALALESAARGNKGRVINMLPFMPSTGGTGGGGSGGDNDFFSAADGVGLLDTQGRVLSPHDAGLIGPVIRINPDTFSRDTLPGRMITDDAPRRGWLYIDTWYVIGPWENRGQLDHQPPHPPEQSIDLDAAYTDGKFAAQPNHPLHTLRWDFYQSDQVHCQPPNLYSNSTYYAYTELYSDRDREVLFTISTDDAAKVWLDDTLIWEDIGGSPWQVGEGFRRVRLKRGYNKLLVRIENGPIHCVWSVLFCPVQLAGE